MVYAERKEVYKGIKKGDILQFRTCKDLMKVGEEMEEQGFKTLQINQINGKQGLFLVVTERKQMISDYLLKKCSECKTLEEEKAKLKKELEEIKTRDKRPTQKEVKKMENLLEIEKDLKNVRCMIAITLIEELGI